MIWIAKYNDGTVLRQHEVGKHITSKDIDRSRLERFILTESSGDTAIQFSSDSGSARFSNIDYQKMLTLEDKSELTFVFNRESETWVLNNKSHQLYKSVMVSDEGHNYFSIEFDQTGKFFINGQEMYVGYCPTGREDIPFIGQPPYTDFEYIISAQNDFFMGNRGVGRKSESVTAHTLVLNTEYKHELANFKVRYEVNYDILKSYVMLMCDIHCDRPIQGSFVTFMGGNRTANYMNFETRSVKQIRRILTMI